VENTGIELLGYESEFGKVTAVKRLIINYRRAAGKSTKNRPTKTHYLDLPLP
jgi:hypothetical protein